MRAPDTTGSPTGLAVVGVTKTWGTQTVLADVSFDLPPGILVGIAGSNGAGKSTLLRCLAGLTAHTGSVHWHGRALTEPSARRGFAYLPQDVVLPPTATVAEVLTLFAHLRRTHPDDSPLPEGFVPAPDEPVGKLSGGQQQRVAIAAALLGRPQLLLLDEPDANLDPRGRHELWQAVAALTHGGSLVLVATPRIADHPFDVRIELDAGRLRRSTRRDPAEVLI